MDALSQALANAQSNSAYNKVPIHLGNLDPNEEYIQDLRTPLEGERKAIEIPPPYYNPQEVAFSRDLSPQEQLPSRNHAEASLPKALEPFFQKQYDLNMGQQYQSQAILGALKDIQGAILSIHSELSKKQGQTSHKSLRDWSGFEILEELIQRENDLMPFWYELLKHVPSPELKESINQAMNGKRQSLQVLAFICASLSTPTNSDSEDSILEYLTPEEVQLIRERATKVQYQQRAATIPTQYL